MGLQDGRTPAHDGTTPIHDANIVSHRGAEAFDVARLQRFQMFCEGIIESSMDHFHLCVSRRRIAVSGRQVARIRENRRPLQLVRICRPRLHERHLVHLSHCRRIEHRKRIVGPCRVACRAGMAVAVQEPGRRLRQQTVGNFRGGGRPADRCVVLLPSHRFKYAFNAGVGRAGKERIRVRQREPVYSARCRPLKTA